MKRLIGRASQFAFAGMIITTATAFASTLQKPIKEIEAVPGEYVVRLKEQFSFSATKNNIQILSEQLGSQIKTTIPSMNIVVVKRPVFETQTSVRKILAQNELVDIVEPNYIYRIKKTPNDPLLPELWGMKNSGQKDSSNQVGVAGVDIGAEKAWDIETGSKNTIVAVIDTGVNYNSDDLKENMWTNEAEANGQPGVDDDGNGFVDDIHGYNFVANNGDPMDDHGHGSHCSGTIGARGNDGKGLVGVNWDVRIMGLKFLSKDGSGSLDGALKAIDYASKMGAHVLSNSWGGGGASDTLKQAIERSNAAGAVFVAAAGNESNNNDASPSYPASYDVPNMISVAAVDNRGLIASFSNYGKKSVHVGAPGVNIKSVTTTGYESWSGTSMATPHVSGIAALLISHESKLTNIDVKNRILATAVPVASLRSKTKTGGLANAYAALTNTLPQPDPNDPSNWKTVNVSVSTPHPYKEKSKETYEVTVPGAKEISLYFSKFDTERDYDIVEIYDGKGTRVQTLSGENDDSYTVVISGNKAKIVLTADDSVSRYGFDVTKAAWR